MPALPSVPLSWLLGGCIAGYLLVMFTNPVRANLRDGLRCVRRYSAMWLTLGAFGFAYALFQLLLRFYFHSVLPPEDRPVMVWAREAWRDPQLWLTGSSQSLWYLPPHSLRVAVTENALPALESVAGIFNLLVATFPLSAFAAFLFFTNWENHHAVLLRALRKRFGHWGWLLYAGILVCALAALAKPLLYAVPLLLGLSPAAAGAWFQWAPVAEWLSFLFEYLAGVCVQIGLILIAFCWVRGITFTRANLIDFAIRRLSFVVRWALLVMLLSTLLLHLPLILKNFAPWQSLFPPHEAAFDARWKVARGVLTAVLLLFSTMQITLTFHSESLAKAFRDHWQFLRIQWWPLIWFFILAGVHFYLLRVAIALVQRGFGEGTALGIAWGLLAPWLNGVVAAWLLASWVCFYRQSAPVRTAQQPTGVLEQGVLF